MGAFKGALIGLICHANRPHAPSCFWLGQEGGEEGRESNQGRCSLHFEKPVEGKEDATPSHVAADARRRHGGTPHAPPRHLELPYVVPTTGYRSLCLWHSLHRLASRGESLVLLLLWTKRERSKEEWGLFRVRGIASSSWWRRRGGSEAVSFQQSWGYTRGTTCAWRPRRFRGCRCLLGGGGCQWATSTPRQRRPLREVSGKTTTISQSVLWCQLFVYEACCRLRTTACKICWLFLCRWCWWCPLVTNEARKNK